MPTLSALHTAIYDYFSKRNEKTVKDDEYSTFSSKTKLHLQKSDKLLLNSLKNRFNYASSDCSARIIASHPSIRSAPSILQRGKDSYLRYKCACGAESDTMFVILELCEEIRVDSVIFGNYEMFAGTARRIRLSGSKSLLSTPEDPNWILLQDCDMMSSDSSSSSSSNVNRFKDQAFSLKRVNFYKFVKIEFFDQIGDEFYCSLSQVKFYGKSMLEEYKDKTVGDAVVVSTSLSGSSSSSSSSGGIGGSEVETTGLQPSHDEHSRSSHSKNNHKNKTKKLNKIFKEMTIIQSQMSKFPSLNVSTSCPQFHPQCSHSHSFSDPLLLSLQSRYSALEAESIELQNQPDDIESENVNVNDNEEENVFKNLNDRLKRIELILPENIIGKLILKSRNSRFNSDISSSDTTSSTSRSNLVTIDNTNFDLSNTLNIPTISTTENTETIDRLMNKLTSQNYLISSLIICNILFLLIFITYFTMKLWKRSSYLENEPSTVKRSNSTQLRRYPLTSLKSTSTSRSTNSSSSNLSSSNSTNHQYHSNAHPTITLNHQHSTENNNNIYSPEYTPGVVLSDDEILFADARLLNTSTTRRKRFEED